MKKIIVLLIALCIVINFNSNYYPTDAKEIILNKKKLLMEKGESYKLKIKNASKKTVWKSRNHSIAIISKNGKVRAKKIGRTVITANIGRKKIRCKVTVTSKKKEAAKLVYNNNIFTKELFIKTDKITYVLGGSVWEIKRLQGLLEIFSKLTSMKLIAIPDDVDRLYGTSDLIMSAKNKDVTVMSFNPHLTLNGRRYYFPVYKDIGKLCKKHGIYSK